MYSIAFDASDVTIKTDTLSRTLLHEGRVALERAGNDVVQNITQSGTYYQNRTGKLSQSFQLRPVGELGMSVTSRSKIATIVDQGSRAHIIRPKAASGFVGPLPESQTRGRRARPKAFLAFQIGGRWVFARQVRHPGTKAKHFVEVEARRLEFELLPSFVAEATDKAIAQAGFG